MSIFDRAMLVKLTIHQWQNRVTDKAVTREIADKYQLEEREDRYVKALLPNAATARVSQSARNLRAMHHSYTLPWQDDSVRILPSAIFFQYRQGMAALHKDFDDSVEQLIEQYPKWMEHAKRAKKGLFDESQYPSQSHLKNLYGIDTLILPFPSAADFRVEMDATQLREIKTQTEAALSNILATATVSLLDRIVERVRNVYMVLVDPDKIFRDNTILSVMETVELVESLNVTKSEMVEDACNATRAAFRDVLPDGLRVNPNRRQDLVDRCLELLNAFKRS